MPARRKAKGTYGKTYLLRKGAKESQVKSVGERNDLL